MQDDPFPLRGADDLRENPVVVDDLLRDDPAANLREYVVDDNPPDDGDDPAGIEGKCVNI